VDSWDYLGYTKSCDCSGDLKKLLDSSPFKEKLADLKERKCINDDPKCGSCDKPSTLGGYRLEKKTPKDWPHSRVGSIVICADKNIPRHDNIEEVLRHEMQHADRQCGEPICEEKEKDSMSCCAKTLCHEMKAYFCESPKNDRTWDELADAAYNSLVGKDCARWFTKASIKWNARKICPGPLPKHKNNCYITFPKTEK